MNALTHEDSEAIVRDPARLSEYLNSGGDPDRLMSAACQLGIPSALKTLLDAGADPNLTHYDACVPLRACAQFGTNIDTDAYACIKLLVERGADVNRQLDYGSGSLRYILGLYIYRDGECARDAIQLLIDNGAVIELDDPVARRDLKHVLQKRYPDIWRTHVKRRDAQSREAFMREVIDTAKREIVEELTAYGGPAFVALMQKYQSA